MTTFSSRKIGFARRNDNLNYPSLAHSNARMDELYDMYRLSYDSTAFTAFKNGDIFLFESIAIVTASYRCMKRKAQCRVQKRRLCFYC